MNGFVPDIGIITRLAGCALVPIAISVIVYLLQKKTRFGKLHPGVQQIIIGILFGLAAVFGTEYGVNLGGATANARDAAPLCAGLLFGGPAGVLAGIIGGVHRWVAVAWGAGAYSQVACSVSTVFAGFYAAFLRKFLFENKRPTWSIAFITGFVMEIIHMTVLFLTHFSDSAAAFEIVRICAIPMAMVNGAAVLAAAVALTFLSPRESGKKRLHNISNQMQTPILVAVVLAYLASTVFVYCLQTYSAQEEAAALMRLNLTDVTEDVNGGAGLDDNDLTLELKKHIANRHIGENGFLFAADSKGNIICGPSDTASALSWDENVKKLRPEGMFESSYKGLNYCVMSQELEGFTLYAALPESEIYADRDSMAYVNSFMEILIYAALFLLIYFVIKIVIVNNLRRVNNSLSEIIGGKLDTVVDVHSSEEFSSLSDDINATVGTLEHYIEVEKNRIAEELALARNIQYAALPSAFPPFPDRDDFSLSAMMFTAKEVGGDFYDYYLLSPGKLAFMVADVSGKGVPAAMFMMTAKTTIKGLAETGLPVEEIFTRANEKLCAGNDADMFLTAWMGILDTKTGHIEYANAGHNPPVVCRRDGSVDYLKSRAGFVLAGMEGIRYRRQELDLAPGDRLMLYTDGVTEANRDDNAMYGEDRLLEVLADNFRESGDRVLVSVKADIDIFAQGCEQFDDITMLTLDYNGENSSRGLNYRAFDASDEAFPDAAAHISAFMEKAGASKKAINQMAIAFEEVFINVAHYAYPQGGGRVGIGTGVENGMAVVEISDSGTPFNPLDKEDPDITLSAEDRAIGGLGIFMAGKLTDELTYVYRDGKNVLTMKKQI